FFQAEDGIRCPLVTGVQTCALPILADDLYGRVLSPLDPRERFSIRVVAERFPSQTANPHGHRPGPVDRSTLASPGRCSRRRPFEIGRASWRGRVESRVVVVDW